MTELTAELLVDRLEPVEIAVSPEGRLVAFTARPVGQREEHPSSEIWLARCDAAGLARRFTSGAAEDRLPRFGPDGATLYFLSDRAERKLAQLYRLHVGGGEAEQVTDEKAGVGAYEPLADGERVALLSADGPSEEDERRKRERDDADVFGEWKPQRLRVLDLATGETRTLAAAGERHVRAVVPAPSGALAALVLWETPEVDNVARAAELALVDLDADELVETWPLAAGAVTVAWLDDRRLCLLGPVEAGGQAGYGVHVVSRDDDAPRLVSGGVHADPVDLAATGAPLLVVAHGLDSYFARLEGEELVPLARHPGTIMPHAASRDGRVVACCLRSGIPDVWCGPPDGELVRLSDLAPEFAAVGWGAQERLAWRGPDGLELDGLLILPPGRTRADAPFPLVLLLHGGPYWRFADDLQLYWGAPGQWLATCGYAVLCANPRGGLGHGAAFARSVRGAVGAADWPDVVVGLDTLVAEGVADPDRLALGGWSQGGFMTAWGVAQTQRFRAAVDGAGPTDWGMMVAESDVPTFEASLGGSTGWEGPGPHRHDELSPVSYAHRMTTPMLILHGEHDERVPVSQARFLARALRAHGVEFELVVYPREPHGIGERNHLLDLLGRWRDWLAPRLA
ncbi:MAG TPA: prolyl oligopeptidase family serine peptidase [Gaiellaceae bacterium]|nr:prolyl oligopeptidase family serine peptidase [Gaiellaceae bacterium]